MLATDGPFVARVLAKNDLANEVQDFILANETVRYIDRHVLDVDEPASATLRAVACEAAVALAKTWLNARRTLARTDVLISVPYAIVDDSWILGAENAPPPHVVLCLARDEVSLRPANYNLAATPRSSSGLSIVDSLVREGARLKRLDSDPELPEDGGCWILEVDE